MLSQALLLNRSPRLEDLTTEAFDAAARAIPRPPATSGSTLYALQRAVAALGLLRSAGAADGPTHAPASRRHAPAWAEWVERWHATSTLTPRVRATVRTILAKAGRWLAAEHPEITEPGQLDPADLRRLGRRASTG